MRAAYYPLFLLTADDVLIDLLTTSGTGAMSARQWAGIMEGDRSYAQSRRFDHFRDSIRDVLMYQKSDMALNDTHLDTTRLGGRGNVPGGAIGSVEIGTLMFRAAATWDLVRFAIPRRAHMQSHVD